MVEFSTSRRIVLRKLIVCTYKIDCGYKDIDLKMTEKVYEQPNPLIGSDGEELFVVEKIVEERRVDGYLEYKVRWEGYPPSEDVWKDAKEMKVSV